MDVYSTMMIFSFPGLLIELEAVNIVLLIETPRLGMGILLRLMFPFRSLLLDCLSSMKSLPSVLLEQELLSGS